MVTLSKIDTEYQFFLQVLRNILAKKEMRMTALSLDAEGTSLVNDGLWKEQKTEFYIIMPL